MITFRADTPGPSQILNLTQSAACLSPGVLTFTVSSPPRCRGPALEPRESIMWTLGWVLRRSVGSPEPSGPDPKSFYFIPYHGNPSRTRQPCPLAPKWTFPLSGLTRLGNKHADSTGVDTAPVSQSHREHGPTLTGCSRSTVGVPSAWARARRRNEAEEQGADWDEGWLGTMPDMGAFPFSPRGVLDAGEGRISRHVGMDC